MITTSQENQIKIIQLNRKKANALNYDLIKSISEHLNKIKSDESVKGIILTGHEGMFSAGLDIVELYDKDREYMKNFWFLFSNLLLQIYSFPKLIFTAISGHSPAGGTVISIMTDYRIMAKGKYVIGLNEVAVGLTMPISIGKVFQSLLGDRIAEKMTLLGQLVDPLKAYQIGLIDEVVSSHDLLTRTKEEMNSWLKLPYNKQINSKLSLRSDIINIMKENIKSNSDNFIDSWFSSECRDTLSKIINKISKK